MAFHERLSRTQQILLAVFCCPLLPFYLCYLCCCGSKEEKNDKEKGHELERAEEGKSSLSRQRDPTYSHTSPGKDAKKNETISYDNKGFIDEKNKQNSTQKAYHVYQVPIEINEENTTPTLSKKNSLGKGKETKKNDKNLKKSFDNKGFIADNKKKETSVKTAGFAYPWDQSSLKSLQVDLKKFKQLDVFASQVSTRSSVEVLVKELLQKAQTDLEKLRAIWMWVTHHIEYDVKGYYNTELRTGVPGDVLQSGKAVCAGYAGLFKEMCRFAGINCVMVSGHSKGFSYEPGDRFTGSGNHAWNAVSLEGRWHLLDSTWGAGNVNSNCSQFTFQYNEFYFLTHPALFIGDHFPLKDEWQLLNPRVSLRQFEKALMKMSGFYSCDLRSINPDSSLIETVNGKATITVKSQSPALFTHTLNGKDECGIITLTADGMILDIYPKSTGKHKLNIFAKPFDAEGEYSFVCEYHLQCESVHKEMKLPSAMMNPVGPSWLTEMKGLLQPSQCSPIVYTQDGRCAFRFLVEKDLSFILKLSLDNGTISGSDLERHVFGYREGNWVEFKIQIPRAGMYLFTIFAKEKSTPASNEYVCNYVIFCSNPRVQWPAFPLVYSTWQQEYKVEGDSNTVNGKATITVKSPFPALFTHTLNGKDECGIITLTADGMILDIYPKNTGKHKLNIFAKPFDAEGEYSFVCEYHLQCESVHKEMKLPSAMMNPVGPSWLTEIEGLLQPSQCSPIVYTQDGRCAFRFLLEKDLSFVLKLSLENVNVSDDLSRHLFIYREGNWVEFKIQIPRAGMYLFTIFAKEKSAPGKNHHFVCNYLISCSNPSVQWPVFPLVYASWQQDYELVEPLSGVLPAQRTLQFKVKILGVAKVLVGSRDTQELSVSSDGYWTGSCSTAGCKDLTVMVRHKPNDSSYSLVLQYQVENN